mmetsp:Transcript_98802/g.288216  ORF Transcript_98802/g.288216 Transcript_98802/m.288216 type:complete len:279 (+) Transcript_98802:2106-2942(+)
MACSRMRAVSKSPSSRIFSRRSSRNSLCVASSPWTRCSRAVFCACTRWNCTCRSSCAVLRVPSSVDDFSARVACSRRVSSWVERCSSCTCESSLARWRLEHSSRRWQTSEARASYSSALFMATMSTSSLTFSWRRPWSSWRRCSTSAEEAPAAGLHSSSPCRRAFSLRRSRMSCRVCSACWDSLCRSWSCRALSCSCSAMSFCRWASPICLCASSCARSRSCASCRCMSSRAFSFSAAPRFASSRAFRRSSSSRSFWIRSAAILPLSLPMRLRHDQPR